MSFTNPHPASRLTLDSTASINSGLVHYWPLTDGSGTSAKDISTTADDLTATGTPTWVSSEIGTAVELVSNTTYLTSSVYGNTYQQWTPITIVLWVSSANAAQNGLFQYGSQTTDGSALYSLQNNSGTLRWYSKNSYGTGLSVSTNTWHQAVLTNDGTSVKYYYDGTLSQTITTSDTYGEDVTNKFWIGAGYRYNNTNQFQNCRIYDRALSATEVATLYNRPWEGTNYGDLWPYNPPVPSSMSLSTDTAATSLNVGLEGWWACTDASGSTLVDISGNGRDATLNGTNSWEADLVGTVNRFDNSSRTSHAETANTQPDLSSGYTFSTWVKHEEAGISGSLNFYGAGIALGNSSGSSDVEIYFNQRLGVVQWPALAHNRSNGGTFKQTGVEYPNYPTDNQTNDNGVWVHYSVTWDGSNARFYRNGTLYNTAAVAQVPLSTSGYKLYINELPIVSANSGLTCSMQNVRLYSRALTADEVTLLYERPWEGEATYGDEFHYDPPTPANLTPLDNSSGIMTDCVGWWPLTETDDYASGAADISGSANTLAKSGTVTSEVSPLGTAGDFIGTASGDLSNTSPSFTVAGADDVSYSVWVNPDSATEVGYLLSTINSPNGSGVYWAMNSGVRAVGLTSGTAAHVLVNIPDLDYTGRWVNVTVTKNGSTGDVVVYIDGVEIGSGTYSYTYTNGGNVVLGNRSGGTDPATRFDGQMQNARIWKRVLTAEEVWSIYQNPWLGSAYSDAAAVIYNYILRSKRFRRL